MTTENTQKNWKNTMAVGALGLATLVSNAQAQDAKLESPKLKLDMRAAYVERAGLNTQNSFTYTTGKDSITGLLETFPDSAQVNYGIDFRHANEKGEPSFRLNLGFVDSPKGAEDLGRVLFTAYGDEGRFIGGTYQHLATDDRFVLHGGADLSDKLHVQGTSDTKGNTGAVAFMSLDKGTLGVGGVFNRNGDGEANISYTNEHLWVNTRFGNRPFDVRLALGNINPQMTRYFQSVTGSGINELDDGSIDDLTFKFDIGNSFFDFFGVEKFLGENVGDAAFDVRYKEDKKIYANGSYRIGDLGPFKDSYVSAGAYRDLAREINGATLETGFSLFDSKNVGARIKADVNEQDATLGAFLQWRF